MIHLNELQKLQKAWSLRNFGKQPAWQMILGLVEEVGELCHAFLKSRQGIRGSQLKHDRKMRDAVGDIVIYLCSFCNLMGYDLEKEIAKAWKEVSKRDWKKNKKNGRNK